jgi:hypothetical protein
MEFKCAASLQRNNIANAVPTPGAAKSLLERFKCALKALQKLCKRIENAKALRNRCKSAVKALQMLCKRIAKALRKRGKSAANASAAEWSAMREFNGNKTQTKRTCSANAL